MLAPVVALVVGAGAAVGGYALIDTQDTVQAPARVVFVDQPAPGAGVRGIDDMTKQTTSVPATVVPYLSHGLGTQSTHGPSAKHESSTAAAIGSGTGH